MARNTNIDEILFPVETRPVFLEKQSSAIPGFKAIVGNLGQGFEKTFSIVSDQYQLILNSAAVDMARQVHRKLFPNASSASFEIFNIIFPSTKSFCSIDIIDKNYTVNIWKREVYVPFVRIHNSYNRSRSLRFDIGFCRKLCDNGVIYEQKTVSLNYSHTKKSLDQFDLPQLDVSHLHKLEKEFIDKTEQSTKIKIPRKYFRPLAAKTLKRSFNLDEKDPKKLKAIYLKLESFKSQIDQYSEKYIVQDNFGETAYSFLNVMTDYVSNSNEVQASAVNGLQAKCGMWINEVGQLVTSPDFSWDEEIKDFEYLLN